MMKAVIFDWDGTVVNNTHLWFSAINKTMEEFGLPKLTFEAFITPVGNPNGEHFPEEIKMEAFKSWSYNYEQLNEQIKLVSGVEHLFTKLKKEGYKIGVVTGGRRERVLTEAKRFKINNLIDVIITRDEAKLDKPDPTGLELASSQLKIKPNECVYIGDMDVDVLAAKNCSMFSISVNWGSHGIEELTKLNPDHIATNLDELYGAIKQL